MQRHVMHEALFNSWHAPDGRHAVVFEEDAHAAYAYLLLARTIIADVWLYNVGRNPRVPPWTDRAARPPFANPVPLADAEVFPRVRDASEIEVLWELSDAGGVVAVELAIRGVRHARLEPGSKPGWCRLAASDGPVARRLGSP